MKSFFPKLFLLISLLLSACGSTAGLSPQMIVMSKLVRAKGVDPFTIHILQSQAFREHEFVLAAYNGANSNGERIECTAFFDFYHDHPNTWAVGSGGSGCGSAGPYGDRPMSSGGGVAHLAGSNEEVYNYLYGQIANPDVVAVTVTWEDGQTQTAPVSQFSFLVLRDEEHSYTKTEHKDVSGKILYTEMFVGP